MPECSICGSTSDQLDYEKCIVCGNLICNECGIECDECKHIYCIGTCGDDAWSEDRFSFCNKCN